MPVSDYKVKADGTIYGYEFITKGPWVDSRAYATLELANTAAYNAGKLLVISQNYTLTANTILTASVVRIPGGSFTNVLGSEKVVNGTFGTSASWIWGVGWAHDAVNFEADKNADGTGALEQNVSAIATEKYQVTFTVKNWTVGSVIPYIGGVAGTAVSANGNYTQYITATGTGNLQFVPTNTARLSIDDISVKRTFPLTINGSFENLNNGQCFIGFAAGDVTFGTGVIKEAYAQWWGAKSDGVTDDTIAIQAAYDSSLCSFMPKGIYLTSSPLTVRSNQTISGAGIQDTIIKNTTTNGLVRQGSPGVTRVTLANFQIQTASTGLDTQVGFDLTGFSYSNFYNLMAQFQQTGFKLSRGSDILAAYFNTFRNIYCWRNKNGLLLEDVAAGTTPNANNFSDIFAEDVGVWSGGNGIDLSGYGNIFTGVYVGLPGGNSAIKIRGIAGGNIILRVYAESSLAYAIDNIDITSGRKNSIYGIHVDSTTTPTLSRVGDADLILFDASSPINTPASPAYHGAFNQVNIRRPEALLTLDSVVGKKWQVISGGGAEVGAGQFMFRNVTDNLNTVRFSPVGDLALFQSGKGIVLTNAAGTVTKRVRLNDLGDGLIFEAE